MTRKVGIVGAGTIGPDIGYYLKSALPKLQLVLIDINEAALAGALKRIAGYAAKGVAKRKLSQEQADAVQAGITTSTDYAALAGCDWVIEAATEDLPLKRKIFAMIEEVVGEDTIITSNTSSLPAERLFSEMKLPGRTTVTHFFAPAWRNPVVEVITWEKSDPDIIAWLRWMFCTTGKVPLVTDDVLCFMLDRVFDNWCNEAVHCLDSATTLDVDSVAQDYVHAGPFFVLNLARGNPIIWHTNSLQMEESEHYRPNDLFRSVASWVTLKLGERTPTDDSTTRFVTTRLLGSLFSQSYDICDRGIASPEDLELGCTLALGFKRGPMDLMSELGWDRVKTINQDFAASRPGGPVPSRPLESYSDFARHVLVDEQDGVKILTLRRPQALNALDDRVTDELLAAIQAHENDPKTKGFVITGYGTRAFSAGADIGRFPEYLGNADQSAQYARDCSRLLRHIDGLSVPVVAALGGLALGGGLELALRCHSIVAHRDAFCQFPEITLGIAPGIGGMVVPYRRWPHAAAIFNEMLRTASRLTAADAHELGIINGLADDPLSLMEMAIDQVRQLADNLPSIPDAPVDIAEPEPVDVTSGSRVYSARVVQIITDAITAGAAAGSLEDALEIGYLAFAESACTEAAKEGVTCFLSRKHPDFTRTG
ncbi:MAG: 3-hydroxyacyl-CoA dehydrogenase NAD-binding domain-containing protein [Planctomycetota bacterium]|nr:3-hydroxyacyl-CoA dehydrogenase NAD-binding domain-containing protein [Planctomycetota bacterium]